MTQPTYAQARTLLGGGGLASETLHERILSVLAMIASGQNPDGTTFALGTAGTISSEVEVKNDAGNPIPTTVTAGLIEVSNDIGNPLPVSGTVAISGGAVEVANDVGNPLPISMALTGTATETVDNTVTNASEVILAANAARKGAIIQNTTVVGGGNARITLSGTDATTTLGIQLPPGGVISLSEPYCPVTAIKAIREGATDVTISVTEIV